MKDSLLFPKLCLLWSSLVVGSTAAYLAVGYQVSLDVPSEYQAHQAWEDRKLERREEAGWGATWWDGEVPGDPEPEIGKPTKSQFWLFMSLAVVVAVLNPVAATFAVVLSEMMLSWAYPRRPGWSNRKRLLFATIWPVGLMTALSVGFFLGVVNRVLTDEA